MNTAFTRTDDFVLARNVAILGELFDRGAKVALMYCGRGFQCNWLGGEAVSLAIESALADGTRQSRYTEIRANGTYAGVMVRQFGNLPFSRVFNAGHEGKHFLIFCPLPVPTKSTDMQRWPGRLTTEQSRRTNPKPPMRSSSAS